MIIQTIQFENNYLEIIDQTLLPNEFKIIRLNNLNESIDAIKRLRVRGAPAIGIVAAYSLYLHARQLDRLGGLNDDAFIAAANSLKNSRPTAVNLEWAIDKLIKTYYSFTKYDNQVLLNKLMSTADEIHKNDIMTCDRIGKYGSDVIRDGFNILTHCNAGILATGGSGTALAPIYTAQKEGKNIHVFVDETRPLGQGARLTYWELKKNNIPATLITDGMAASLMHKQNINMVIVGADRISSNGDFANKIGTYSLAVLARYHQIPFYTAAPASSFDLSIGCGAEIPIEYRDKSEILDFWNISDYESYDVHNPAFDVTPNEFLTGIITEHGIIKPPFLNNIKSIINTN
ncbi:MAG: S-methyl-5-thioribose-1-phosphate isomerase [Calditrichaceae bacterium]